jgi:hypothetical protein
MAGECCHAAHSLARSNRARISRHLRPAHPFAHSPGKELAMIRKLKSGSYRLYSRKKNPKTGRRRNLGTFKSLGAARKHERAVQFFKRH